MLFTGLLTIAAFLIIAKASTGERTSPVRMLAGIALLIASVAGHTLAFTSAFNAVTALTAEFGVGLLLVAGYLSRRRKAGRPFFFLGALSLFVCVVLLGAGRFVHADFLAGKNRPADDSHP